jgi:hypothetical protein
MIYEAPRAPPTVWKSVFYRKEGMEPHDIPNNHQRNVGISLKL